ncbi:ribulose-phosphate 3-epimerase [Alphaproteobacteria bacterium]|nr:ribulose-phosphate 3-epimerase [Alphaproteobacteria bacterium]
MKTIISPSILGGTFSNMEKIISNLDQSEAEYIHFDVMDGDFVPNLTFGPQFISNLRNQTKKVFDVHLMINRVGKFLDDYIKAGSDIITFHIEIEENLIELISRIKDKNLKAGIAIKPNTPWEKIKSLLHSIDQVIIMTVEPGFGGQSFMDSQIDKIKSISKYIKENNLSVDIEIDGGVNYETGKICRDAGANILVAGSFLFKQQNLLTATNELNKYFN